MSIMTRLAPEPGAMFPEVLYIFNRAALLQDFHVRLGEAEDVAGVSTLVEGMPNAADIVAMFLEARGGGKGGAGQCL